MSETKFKKGDSVTYEVVDMEYYSRGYGLSYETKVSSVIAICYKLANGDLIEESKLKPVQSKSEEPKITQNGSSS